MKYSTKSRETGRVTVQAMIEVLQEVAADGGGDLVVVMAEPQGRRGENEILAAPQEAETTEDWLILRRHISVES